MDGDIQSLRDSLEDRLRVAKEELAQAENEFDAATRELGMFEKAYEAGSRWVEFSNFTEVPHYPILFKRPSRMVYPHGEGVDMVANSTGWLIEFDCAAGTTPSDLEVWV